MGPATTRTYLAASAAVLRAALADGTLPAGLPAHAVTPALRAAHAPASAAAGLQVDEEELEDEALADAARSSTGLLGEGDPARRVVLAVDVPTAALRPAAGDGDAPSLVVLDAAAGSVPLARVVSAHADEAGAEPDVRAAVAALTGAEATTVGPAEVEAALERAEEHDLLWYDATELPALLGELGPDRR